MAKMEISHESWIAEIKANEGAVESQLNEDNNKILNIFWITHIHTVRAILFRSHLQYAIFSHLQWYNNQMRRNVDNWCDNIVKFKYD